LAKILEKPEELAVTVNVRGVPLTLVRGGEKQRVTRVYRSWQNAEEWWGKEVCRNYFMVKTNKGMVCDIYRDTPGDIWYLSRIHE
jgi:hypothetical protein